MSNYQTRVPSNPTISISDITPMGTLGVLHGKSGTMLGNIDPAIGGGRRRATRSAALAAIWQWLRVFLIAISLAMKATDQAIQATTLSRSEKQRTIERDKELAAIVQAAKYLVIVIDNKGGIGKSLMLQVAYEVVSGNIRNVLVIDADAVNDNLSRVGLSKKGDALRADRKDFEGYLLDAAEQLELDLCDAAVIDSAAGSEQYFNKHLPALAAQLKTFGARLIIVRPITTNPLNQDNCVEFGRKVMTDDMGVVMVRNLGQGRTEEDYTIWMESAERQEMLDRGMVETHLEAAGALYSDVAASCEISVADIARKKPEEMNLQGRKKRDRIQVLHAPCPSLHRQLDAAANNELQKCLREVDREDRKVNSPDHPDRDLHDLIPSLMKGVSRRDFIWSMDPRALALREARRARWRGFMSAVGTVAAILATIVAMHVVGYRQITPAQERLLATVTRLDPDHEVDSDEALAERWSLLPQAYRMMRLATASAPSAEAYPYLATLSGHPAPAVSPGAGPAMLLLANAVDLYTPVERKKLVGRLIAVAAAMDEPDVLTGLEAIVGLPSETRQNLFAHGAKSLGRIVALETEVENGEAGAVEIGAALEAERASVSKQRLSLDQDIARFRASVAADARVTRACVKHLDRLVACLPPDLASKP